jgi:hypothetical protein
VWMGATSLELAFWHRGTNDYDGACYNFLVDLCDSELESGVFGEQEMRRAWNYGSFAKFGDGFDMDGRRNHRWPRTSFVMSVGRSYDLRPREDVTTSMY